jgi:hypothetical protein
MSAITASFLVIAFLVIIYLIIMVALFISDGFDIEDKDNDNCGF